MNIARRTVTILVIGSLLVPSTAVAPLQAQPSCTAAVDELSRETKRFAAEMRESNAEFIRTDTIEVALNGVRKHLSGNPTSEALFDLRDKKSAFDQWQEALVNARATFDDLVLCMKTTGCVWTAISKRADEIFAKFMGTLGEDGLTAAAERASKASQLLRGYMDRALNVATKGTLAAVQECTADVEQRILKGTTDNEISTESGTVNGPGATPPPGGGHGGLIAILGGAVGGGLLLGTLTKPEDVTTTGRTSATTGGSTSPQPTTPTSATYTASVSRQCTLGAGNVDLFSRTFQEPCVVAIAQGSCNPEGFTVMVSGGTVRDCGSWLSGTVSGTSFTGFYHGVCGLARGVAVSGTLPGSISGNDTCAGNTYRITITTR